MISTIMLVGVLAISFSGRISDTTLSLGWMTHAYAAKKSEPLDLNIATADQLKALPGIGVICRGLVAELKVCQAPAASVFVSVCR